VASSETERLVGKLGSGAILAVGVGLFERISGKLEFDLDTIDMTGNCNGNTVSDLLFEGLNVDL
jgi:hypothetical protein